MATSLKAELRLALRVLNSRRMIHSAKWIAELLTTVEDKPLDKSSIDPRLLKSASNDNENDQIMLALVYFDHHEYNRCAHALRGCSSDQAFFLRCYAQFMKGEQLKEQDLAEASSLDDKSSIINKNLESLAKELEMRYHGDNALDAFGLYLYGMVLKEMKYKDRARQVLVETVQNFPYIWSAWTDLAVLCRSKEAIQALPLRPAHWMRTFFTTHALIDLQDNKLGLQACQNLKVQYPRCMHVNSMLALAFYNARDFVQAKGLFEGLLKDDPHRLDSMDIYSNILYVLDKKSDLSCLAHRAVRTDKYRAETCCIVGNYYSLKQKHVKAVLYFRRALKLDRHCLSAWTLMGHEYVELKQLKAAIDAYRCAVDVNPHDYRAWYGLGQTYEIHQMFFYALHYYRKACTLRPDDPRMWCAMAQCYTKVKPNRRDCAIKCYERAVELNDFENIAKVELARLYKANDQPELAAKAYENVLSALDKDATRRQPVDKDTEEALLFLARYSTECGKQSVGDVEAQHRFYDRAQMYLDGLSETHSAKKDAESIRRELQSLRGGV